MNDQNAKAQVIEELAEIQHEIWSHWMNWMLKNGGDYKSDGIWTMFTAKLYRWQRQINTSYHDLTEKEKESDRKIVEEFFDEFLEKYVYDR